MKPILSFILVTLTFLSFGQYSIDQIPEELLDDADAVILENIGELTILRKDRATYKVKKRIAILNPDGQKFAYERIWYDKLRKVEKLSGEAFGLYGQSLKKLKKSDLQDYSAISGFSIYEDNRVLVGDLRQNKFPYFVEFEFEITFNQTYLLPDWYILPDDEIGAVFSSFEIKAPKEIFPQYKVLNIEDLAIIETIDGNTSAKFTYEKVPPIKYESHLPRDIHPAILISPKSFLVSGYEGSFESWNDFGNFQKTLNSGLDDLPYQTAQKVRELTSGTEDSREKIRKIYEYVQNNTRYVSIQLGIGGWQPFANSIVDETGYGDCKALSFYTQSLLKEIGIPSNYTIVYAGSKPFEIDPEFVASRFNHVFLCVPNKGDTVWLECTSQTNPFGYLSNFTSDRDVLLVTEEGGKIVRTPKYDANVNTQITTASVTFDNEMNADIELNIQYQGLQYDNGNLPDAINLSSEKQKEWVLENVDVPGMQIKNYVFNLDKKPIPESGVNINLTTKKLATSMGKRQFLFLNQFSRIKFIPEKNENRQFDISIRYGYKDSDSVIFKIPSNYRPEYLPDPIEVHTEFGYYKMSVVPVQAGLLYRREVLWKDGLFDKKKYEAYREFWSTIVKSDKMKIALIDKT